MKRFHVHIGVDNLQDSIAFYNRLFNAQPTRVESDYAKWMLDDPRINFAISTRSQNTGLDHLGFQVDSDEELQTMKAQAQSADMALINEGETSCCYAASDKYWITDPQGIAWEQFRTLGNIPVFSQSAQSQTTASSSDAACCAPASPDASATASTEFANAGSSNMTSEAASNAASACCAPTERVATVSITPRGKPIGVPVKNGGGCCG